MVSSFVESLASFGSASPPGEGQSGEGDGVDGGAGQALEKFVSKEFPGSLVLLRLDMESRLITIKASPAVVPVATRTTGSVY